MLSRSRKMMMKRRELYEQQDMVICSIMCLQTKGIPMKGFYLLCKDGPACIFEFFRMCLLYCTKRARPKPSSAKMREKEKKERRSTDRIKEEKRQKLDRGGP